MRRIFHIAIFVVSLLTIAAACKKKKNENPPPVESQSQYILYQLTPSWLLKFIPPTDTLRAERIGSGTRVTGQLIFTYDAQWTLIKFNGPAAPGNYTIDSFYLALSSAGDFYKLSSPFNVHVTRYDSVGGFIAGDFSGDVLWYSSAPSPAIVPISCQFRVKRYK